ncbi:hypothetical protein HGA91_03590 [candidate division WWE3 bacterium]|nr:hypothetical protein [candidate division WWE3 bacterium]
MLKKITSTWHGFSTLQKILFIVGILLGFIAATLVVFELLSRVCPAYYPAVDVSCAELDEKYAPNGGEIPYFMQPQKQSLDEVLEDQIIYVPQEEIGTLNGITCGYYAYVSKDLPGPAKTYVSIHEAMHVLGEGSETQANLKAAKLAPFGMIVTVIHTALASFTRTPIQNWPCTLGRLWGTFKVYFLGNDWSGGDMTIF